MVDNLRGYSVDGLYQLVLGLLHLLHVVVVVGGGGGDIGGGVGVGVGVDQLSRVRLSCSDSDLSVRSVSTWSKQGGRQPLVPWYLQQLL